MLLEKGSFYLIQKQICIYLGSDDTFFSFRVLDDPCGINKSYIHIGKKKFYRTPVKPLRDRYSNRVITLETS